ncbi:MAG: hypothetical protein K0R67_3290, partial [Paenibacillus sp.]|nr:hypothetical protein [Paenibacillus sp.]
GVEAQPGEELNGKVEFEIDVAANPTLKAMGQSGHAKMLFGYDELYYRSGGIWPGDWERYSSFEIFVDGVRKYNDLADDHTLTDGKGSITFTDSSKIEIHIKGGRRIFEDGESPMGAKGVYIKFEDKERPEMTGYTFTGNGAERQNTTINQRELYVKQNEHVTLDYKFSEPVMPTAVFKQISDPFLRHPLFINPGGTGLPAAGQQQYLENQTYNENNLTSLFNHVEYKYNGVKYHQSGNNPVPVKITGTTTDAEPMNQTLEEKFKAAKFADAAGNMATINFQKPALSDSNEYLRENNKKIANPFDYTKGGYRVIVDAVAPKYTKVGNGIQPEILTGVTLNKLDSVDFTLQMTEEAVVNRDYWGGNVTEEAAMAKTFLLFNNGMKAYYHSGSGTANWVFRLPITAGAAIEVPLLKAISLSHDNKLPADSDKNVIQDYAGNLLIQPANFEGIHTDGDQSNVNSKIDWAQLSIDNTKPIIGFRYESDGASDLLYKKNGKMTIDANDPQLLVPALDPIVDDRLTYKPSKGIYRPSNQTGAASPAVGLVYYMWSKTSEDPFSLVAGDHYAAIKRYSLSAKQPGEELYPGEYQDVNLKVVNNKTNLIAPPAEALTDADSGVWYLHTWTADMSWDSARELMQYEKMKNYVTNNPVQYNIWKSEAAGSESDKIVYANNKAMLAVGQYGDTSIWPITDFKKEDSNWSYQVGSIKYDNRAPAITMEAANGSNTAVASIPVTVTEAHSGVQTVLYQWVKTGAEINELDWREATLSGDQATLSTLNKVIEDGQYDLYVKATDEAGNTRTTKSAAPVTIDSTVQVPGEFVTLANPSYVKSHDVVFAISGIGPQTVNSVTYATYGTVTDATYAPYVSYSLSTSSMRPDENSAYTIMTAFHNDNEKYSYLIPIDSSKDGIQYVHIKVKVNEAGHDRYYYFSKAYFFDNFPPKVTFSSNGVSYPQREQSVTITVTAPPELSSSILTKKQYQWLDHTLPAPDESSAGWTNIPESGVVKIDNTALAVGEVVDYRLYVLAQDGAGNTIIQPTTGSFKITKTGGENAPPAPMASNLIYLYGDQEDGYTAIVELSLESIDKEGYDYSVSPDNGLSWVTWKPYTNFVAVKVPTNIAEDLRIQFKVRTPFGVIGEPRALKLSGGYSEEPVYALASLSTTRPVNPDVGVDINIAPPLGIKVVASAANPEGPIVRTGNKFNVKKNGYYSFDLTDTADPSRKATLYIVVDNVDGTVPEGTIEYLVTEATTGNVSVKLNTSEPVVITNNNGRGVYSFEENGSFEFKFKDEAGNTGTATATVTNIERETPRVRIVRSYAYGENDSQTFGTIRDADNNVLVSSGVTLIVENEPGYTTPIVLPEGADRLSKTVRENGTVSFKVSDAIGNVVIIEETVTNIQSQPPQAADIVYTYVDDAGEPIPSERIVTINGQQYAKGKVKVTLSGQTASDNKVFSGVTAIQENGEYTNSISGPDGAFTYSRIFASEGTTKIAISDLLGNVNKIPVTIKGLDNTPPEIKLNAAVVGIAKNKPDFDFRVDLGGYSVTDNLSAADQITVSISGLDLTKVESQTVTYTAVDQAGNVAVTQQKVIVMDQDGMLIFANNILIAPSIGEIALFDTNQLTFQILNYNVMEVNGEERINEWGTFDVFYQEGLYREGIMKNIASKITYNQLLNNQYKVTFPDVGWYTIIVRNQERERAYSTFFIGSMD